MTLTKFLKCLSNPPAGGRVLFSNRENHGFYPWMKREKTNSPKAKPEDTAGFARGSLLFFLAGAVLGGIFLLLCLTAGAFWVKNKYVGKVYPGVSVFSRSMAGKTSLEVEEFLAEKEKQILKRKIIFLGPPAGGGGERRWEIIPQMIDFSLDKAATAKEVFTSGKGTRPGNFLEIYRLLVLPVEIAPSFNYSREKLRLIVGQMSQEIDRPAQDALFEFKNNKVTSFQVSKEGRSVDTRQVESLIILAFNNDNFEKNTVAVDLPVKIIAPKITTDQTNDLGIKELLATGESFFKDSIPSRVHNIILASSYLHGVVIPPGETFSFAEKIGDISAATGYQQAYVIKERKTILEDGGGVCQVSTTMFRAALNAGLPISERQAHYYRVGFYEQGGYPPGLDATVYSPSPDLKFKNDTATYILIQTKIDKQARRLAFEFYGTADGRRAEIEKPLVHSQTEPPEPIYVDEPNLPAGTVKRIDTAHWGAKVSFKRKVFTSTGELKEDRTFWSNYVPWPAVYQRGVGQ